VLFNTKNYLEAAYVSVDNKMLLYLSCLIGIFIYLINNIGYTKGYVFVHIAHCWISARTCWIYDLRLYTVIKWMNTWNRMNL